MTSIETRGPSPSLIDAVRSQQVRMLYAQDLVSVLSVMAISAGLTGLLVWQQAMAPVAAGVWLGVMTLYTALRLGLSLSYRRARPAAEGWRPWANRYVVAAATGGLIWACGMPWLLPPGRFDLQMVVIVMLVSGTYGFIGSAGPYLPAFATFALPAIPIVLIFLHMGDLLHIACAILFVLWLPTVGMMGWRYNSNLVEAIELRFQNAALAEDLRGQKLVAEQNSLAKSRFLAAASHDLRQPVHALGMFVGALRNQRLPPRAETLIDHIDDSVAAMDGLFSSLLDISRLDAGVVERRMGRVPLEPLIGRICRDLQAQAAQKGVALQWARTSTTAVSDPVLLERILRNLIGNAVLYTPAGRVLVGVRRRRDELTIEVWDTGPGIPADQQETVFEEFYQLANPDRDRAKGLGLGLAIVRRLTGILEHGLSLDSQPGRGSVFRITAERAVSDRAEPARPAYPAPVASDLILAIDDEAQIRVAMAELLESWGHQVVLAGGGDEAIEALAGRRPRLIICDYRLRGGETGVAVIHRLQAVLGAGVPALLLTGDTAPQNIREALSSGYPLLHKPLSHGRLRAAVTALLRQAGGAGQASDPRLAAG